MTPIEKTMFAGLLSIACLSSLVVMIAARLEVEQRDLKPVIVQAVTPAPTSPAVTAEKFPAVATWYGAAYEGKLTAAGAHKSKAVPENLWHFDMFATTCAHPTLPFGTWVRVWFLARFVECMVTDRPGKGVQVIDLSAAAFHQLAPLRSGRLNVVVEVLK